MKFIVSFLYMDGEKFELEVAEGDMEGFIEAVGKSEVFFNTSAGIGIFIPIDKVRYFKVERVDGQGRRVVASNSRISNDNGSVKCGPSGDIVEGEGSVAGVVPVPQGDTESTRADDGAGE